MFLSVFFPRTLHIHIFSPPTWHCRLLERWRNLPSGRTRTAGTGSSKSGWEWAALATFTSTSTGWVWSPAAAALDTQAGQTLLIDRCCYCFLFWCKLHHRKKGRGRLSTQQTCKVFSVLQETNEKLAVKMCRLDLTPKNKDRWSREIQIMKKSESFLYFSPVFIATVSCFELGRREERQMLRCETTARCRSGSH